MTLKEIQTRREQKTAYLLISTLGSMFAADPDKIIDMLTGYLFDEEESGDIKRQSNVNLFGE